MEGFRSVEGRSWDQAGRQPGEQSRHAGDAPLRSRPAVALGCRGGAGVVGSVDMWVMPLILQRVRMVLWVWIG